jgi:hypothetical protein
MVAPVLPSNEAIGACDYLCCMELGQIGNDADISMQGAGFNVTNPTCAASMKRGSFCTSQNRGLPLTEAHVG